MNRCPNCDKVVVTFGRNSFELFCQGCCVYFYPFPKRFEDEFPKEAAFLSKLFNIHSFNYNFNLDGTFHHFQTRRRPITEKEYIAELKRIFR